MTGATAIELVTGFVLAYFVALNGGYLALNLLSLLSLYRGLQERVLDELPQAYTELEPPISVIVPAYNEELSIVASIRSMMQLEYSEFEIIVVNDGSRDSTLEVLQREFALQPFPEAMHAPLETKPVRGIWRSAQYPNLRVIDKLNGGKADSMNAGINLARHPLFCGVDADSILERNALRRVARPFLRDPRMVATGGTVRVVNGCKVQDGVLTSVDLPRNPWALFQVVEYLRAFLFGRVGWSKLNALLIISGAFGLFRTETVISVGGYNAKTIGEDMELVVRMHRLLRERGVDYRIEFLPDPVCWTEVPEFMDPLRCQRVRWQRGLSESLAMHWRLMASRRGGAPGWLAFPFMLVFEWLSPLIELGGFIFMIVAWCMGLVSWDAFAIFLFVAVGLGVLLSTSGLLLEEMAFHLYPKTRQLALLALVVVLENFGYRQLNSWWRLTGLWAWACGRQTPWGNMQRRGL